MFIMQFLETMEKFPRNVAEGYRLQTLFPGTIIVILVRDLRGQVRFQNFSSSPNHNLKDLDKKKNYKVVHFLEIFEKSWNFILFFKDL